MDIPTLYSTGRKAPWRNAWFRGGGLLIVVVIGVTVLPLAKCPTLEAIQREMDQTPSTRDYVLAHPGCLKEIHDRTGCRQCIAFGRISLMKKMDLTGSLDLTLSEILYTARRILSFQTP